VPVSLFEDRSAAVADTPEDEVFPPPGEPLAVARHLVDADGLHDPDGVLTLRWWRGSFYLWAGTHWTEIADPAIRTRLYHALEQAQYWKTAPTASPELVPWAPSRRKIADVMEALQAVAHIPEQVEPPASVTERAPVRDGPRSEPLWVPHDDGALALRNGLLHLPTRQMDAHSPRLFNLLALPYDYDRAAPSPRRWLRFLRQLWPGDRQPRMLLQEWFGYLLCGSTRQQKIALVVGPPRSGKGTIARVATALIGRNNTAGPTLASLGTNFGLQPLLSKALAVVSDARLSTDANTVVERLLSISGEDAITVDRKFKEPWTGRLPVRFMILSNELPSLGDASGAIATRFLVLTLTRSWLGEENPALTDALLEELPGILLWSLKGLDRLNAQGHFTEPTSSRDAVITLADLTSPVGAFIREACIRQAGRQVPVRELYQAWRRWSKDHGRDHPTTEQIFGRDLRAVIPGLKVIRPREDGGQERPRHYEGIALTDTYAAYVGAAHNGQVRGPLRTTQGNISQSVTKSGEPPPAWRCDRCDVERPPTVNLDGFRHADCGGRFRPAEATP
jgi:putative DNA primase/helicase